MDQNNFQQLAKTEMDELAAMRAALVSYCQPLRTPKGVGAYPQGMLEVIKIAAGDNATIESMANNLNSDAKTLQEAATFYLQQLHFKYANTPFQKLGLADTATLDEITQHKRWLLKWLHPDRNPNKWQASMFQGVTDAAQQAAVLAASERQPTDNQRQRPRFESLPRGRYHNNPVRPRKPIRVILWRDVFWRISRRLAMMVILGSFVYLLSSQIADPMKQWSMQAYAVWQQK